MEEEKAAVATSSRVSLPPPAAALPVTAPAPEETYRRQMFTVELKPGETTIVSWKKLLKEAAKAEKEKKSTAATAATNLISSSAVPASVQPVEGDIKDAPPATRFSAVIEKIERLYMGEQSSDEENLDDIPDDDQYDTEDSFIDDAELDDYFQVDKMSTKHNGYFVNRGNLEKIESSSLPNLAPMEVKGKDSSKVHSKNKNELTMNRAATTGSMPSKATGKSAPLASKKSSLSSKSQTNFSEHSHKTKLLKNKVDTSKGPYMKRSAELINSLDNPSSLRARKDVALLALESTYLDKHKVKSQSRKSMNGESAATLSTKVAKDVKHRVNASPDANGAGSAYPVQASQPSSKQVKESSLRPKGTTRLERAIRDLEESVSLCRPPKSDIQEDTSQGVKRRIPQEVKQKLAKVARLSASQNRVTEDGLIDRLMGIVGHLVQRKTLKRNMRDMVELGLTAKKQKDDRLQQIKQEVNEMIQTSVSQAKPKVAALPDSSADDFQEPNVSVEKKATSIYSMDTALEDKICDLYDLYVEGMDEEKGPQSRKLYIELAELWPSGYMNNYGIKDAILRSKERKRKQICRNKVRDEEIIKRKKTAEAKKAEPTPTAQLQSGHDNIASNQSIAASAKITEPSLPVANTGHDKAPLSSCTKDALDAGVKMADGKKKIKRKAETELEEIQRWPKKLLLQDTKPELSVEGPLDRPS